MRYRLRTISVSAFCTASRVLVSTKMQTNKCPVSVCFKWAA